MALPQALRRGARSSYACYERAPDFLAATGDRPYGVHLRSVARWREVYKWLRQWAENKHGESDAERLTQDLLTYLQEEGIGEMNEHDVNVHNGYLAFSRQNSEEKIEDKMAEALRMAREVVYRSVPPRAQDGVPMRGRIPAPPGFNNFNKFFSVYDWSYPFNGSDLHIGWGLADSENGSFLSRLNLRPGLQAFVYVQGQGELALLDRAGYPLRTRVQEGNSEFWIVRTDAVDLTRAEGGFTAGFVKWLEPRVREGREILEAARAARGSR